MDYLVIEGYKSAAEEFCQEAGLDPSMDLQSIETRLEIRDSLRRGDIESAIIQVNELNPEASRHSSFPTLGPVWAKGLNCFVHHSQTLGSVMIFVNTKTSVFNMIFSLFVLPVIVINLSHRNADLRFCSQILDTNRGLYFHLQQQRLIELIRHGRIPDALRFAQEELAPRGEESPEFLSELERTMALLAFGTLPTCPPEISELLSPEQRLKTASEVNAAILESFSQGKEVKLVALVKLLCWGESLLEEHVDFPKVRVDIGLGVEESK
jgi:hypothetical protein